MPGRHPTAAELQTLMARLLADAAGGSERRWHKLIGRVEVLPAVLPPECNWRIKPTGTKPERAAITKAFAIIAGNHPSAET